MEILTTIWGLMNTSAGITLLAGLLVFILNFLYSRKPKWAKYEGLIIQALRFAEKNIPDNANNKGLLKADKALQYIIEVYQAREGKILKPKAKLELAELLRIKHHELDISGAFDKVKKPIADNSNNIVAFIGGKEEKITPVNKAMPASASNNGDNTLEIVDKKGK